MEDTLMIPRWMIGAIAAALVWPAGGGAKTKAYGRFGKDAKARLRGGLCA